MYLMMLIFGVTMMIPLASMFNPKKPRSKRILTAYAIVMGLTGLGAIARYAFTDEAGFLAPVYVIGIVAYGWIANALVIR